jgi:hypothetical protein
VIQISDINIIETHGRTGKNRLRSEQLSVLAQEPDFGIQGYAVGNRRRIPVIMQACSYYHSSHEQTQNSQEHDRQQSVPEVMYPGHGEFLLNAGQELISSPAFCQ